MKAPLSANTTTSMIVKSCNFFERLGGRFVLRLPIHATTQAAIVSKLRTGRYVLASRVGRSITVETSVLRQYCYPPLPRRFVVPGDWDREQRAILPDLLECPHFRFVFEVYREGKNYTETKHFQKIMAELNEYSCAERGIRTERDAHAYFENTMAMIEEIRAGRYRSQAELGGRLSDEVRVSIDRDGCLLKYHNGSHRLAAAILFNIPRIPVYVMFVHQLCFEIWCEQYASMNACGVIDAGIQAIGKGMASKSDDPMADIYDNATPSRQ